jgi:ribokinase
VAVVGHVEWVEFIRVAAFPARGSVAAAEEAFARAAGGGVVVADVLSDLSAGVDFFCALGRDANGEAAARQLESRGVKVHAAWREQQTRRVFTMLEDGGERTILTVGERLETRASDDLDWGRLDSADGVYFTAGDAGAAARARKAKVLVASPRAREALERGRTPIDALVFSAADADERAWAERLEPQARLMVQTEGDRGGRWWGESEGRWPAAPPPGPPRDDYGCGDSFAAGFTFGLAAGLSVPDAAALGAERGALTLTVAGSP